MVEDGQLRTLRQMFHSECFDLDYWLQSAVKYSGDKSVLTLLVERLGAYHPSDLRDSITELVFFSLQHPFAPLDRLLVALCADDFTLYSRITTTYAVWGTQFSLQEESQRTRIRGLIEECETAWVNCESRDRTILRSSECAYTIDVEHLRQLIRVKSLRNDLKDEVQRHITELTRLGLSVSSAPRTECEQRVRAGLQQMNDELCARRTRAEGEVSTGMAAGIIFPFKHQSQSNLVVRVVHEETRVFPTRNRVPFLVLFETISVEDAEKCTADWRKDTDLLRWRHGVRPKHLRPSHSVTADKAPADFDELWRFHAEQEELQRRIPAVEHVRAELRGKAKSADMLPDRKTVRKTKRTKRVFDFLGEAELVQRAAFFGLLLQKAEERSLDSGDYRRRLQQTLEALEERKQQRSAGETFAVKSQRLQATSPYGAFPSYCLRAFVFKAGEDFRQESLVFRFLSQLRGYALREGVGVYICDLDFLVFSRTSAMVEFLADAYSVDALKKAYAEQSLRVIYERKFGRAFDDAQSNFVRSLAGYSFCCYLLNIRDRHNANILIGPRGHVVHIDFGFCLGATPRNLAFESAPFKLTNDYIELLDGPESLLFSLFKALIAQMFAVVKKHADTLWAMVEVMMPADLDCFRGFDFAAFKARFHRSLSDAELGRLVEQLVQSSLGSLRTSIYDRFQKYSNNIEA